MSYKTILTKANPGTRDEVSRVSWWMCHFAAPTPKRQYAYGNSPHIAALDRGVLSGWKKKEKKLRVKTAKQYMNAEGKLRYTATSELKRTEFLGFAVCISFGPFVNAAKGLQT